MASWGGENFKKAYFSFLLHIVNTLLKVLDNCIASLVTDTVMFEPKQGKSKDSILFVGFHVLMSQLWPCLHFYRTSIGLECHNIFGFCENERLD